MDKRRDLIKKMVGSAIFAALTVALSLIYIPIAGTAINLGLIPIVLAAIIYGPWAGLFVGVANGVTVIFGAGAYLAISVFGTILTCVLKTGVAGLLAGFVFKALKERNFVLGTVVVSVLVPVVNTSIYIVGCLIFFGGALGSLITLFVAANFLIELAIDIALIPAILSVAKYALKIKGL